MDQPFSTAQNPGEAEPALILTLKLDADSFVLLNRLRRRYFPPERNYLQAHVTLFHALPGTHYAAIDDLLRREAASIATIPLSFASVRSLGHGVAVVLDSPGLLTLRGRLATAWSAWLTPQDRQKFRPHVTVQNKVSVDEARELYEQLSATWQPVAGSGLGLSLWKYRGGPWEEVSDCNFAARE